MQCPKCDQELPEEDIMKANLGLDCSSCNRMRVTHIMARLMSGADMVFPSKLFDRECDKPS
jgi:hypothetical protein